MFKQAEITKMDRIKDSEGIIIKIVSRITITDDEHGNLFTEITCENEDLQSILNATTEEQAKIFQDWITPKIQEIYIPWKESIEKSKSDTLYAKDIQEKFGIAPVITSF